MTVYHPFHLTVSPQPTSVEARAAQCCSELTNLSSRPCELPVTDLATPDPKVPANAYRFCV
jgi:hypothetical protein